MHSKLTNKYAALRYVDATYTYTKTQQKPPAFYVTVGTVTVVDTTAVLIIFLTKQKKNISGLLIPMRALILSKKYFFNTPITKRALKQRIAVSWEDIVRIENGVVPRKPTVALTEGILESYDKEFLVVRNPETILFSEKGELKNHPEKKARFYYIPRKLISKIELYAK